MLHSHHSSMLLDKYRAQHCRDLCRPWPLMRNPYVRHRLSYVHFYSSSSSLWYFVTLAAAAWRLRPQWEGPPGLEVARQPLPACPPPWGSRRPWVALAGTDTGTASCRRALQASACREHSSLAGPSHRLFERWRTRLARTTCRYRAPSLSAPPQQRTLAE